MKKRLYHFLNILLLHFALSMCFGLFIFKQTYAQQVPLMTHYYLNRFLFNPSQITLQDANQLHFIYRNQWAGLQGAPETFLLTYQHTLPTKKMGLGANLKRENLNLIAQTSALASYAYLVNLNAKQKLSFGLSLGVMYSSINWDRVMLEDLIDPKLYSNDDQFQPDGNFSVLYTYNNLQLGFAVHHLFARGASKKFDLNNAFLRYGNHSILSASYKIKPKQGDFTFEPTLLYRFANTFPGQIDISLLTEWKEKVWFSVGYRNSYGYALSIGFKVSENIKASYAYEIANQNVGIASNGTHEIMLNYTFGKRKNSEPIKEKEVVEKTTNTTQNPSLPEKYANLPIGQPYILPTIKFGNNSNELDKSKLDELGTMLKNNPKLQIEIGVHTDNTINANASKTLTQKRAESIKQYLMSKGAKGHQLSSVGYGNLRPLQDNNDEMNNNRVEIKFLKK